MAKLAWTEPALSQLDEIASIIALDKPEAARMVVARVFEATDRVEQFVKLGRRVPEFPRTNYRQVWINPCWVYYRIDGERIYVLHVRRAEKLFRPEDLSFADEQ
ncbi:MAG TPA: type II toxin-antitoxin system RelE/ParE family toxin [Opitutaceae bacterium]|jgi:plasmid stabilization system protein ParE